MSFFGHDLNLLLSGEITCVMRGVENSTVMNQHKIILKRCLCKRNHGIAQNVYILETVEGPIDEHQLRFGITVDSTPNHDTSGSVAMSCVYMVIV